MRGERRSAAGGWAEEFLDASWEFFKITFEALPPRWCAADRDRKDRREDDM